MAVTTFSGPIKSQAGSYTQGPGSTISLTAATTLDPATHAGRILRLNLASITLTLPAIDVTTAGNPTIPSATNNVGVTFTFYVETSWTSNFITTTGSNFFIGSLAVSGTTTQNFQPNGTTHIKLIPNGTTTGALAGSQFTVTALASGKWNVQGQLVGSGTVATPFST